MNASPQLSFDRIADRYDATRVLPADQQDRIARGILAAVGGGMGTRFIEPGVGTGRIALPLLRQGVNYVGTDIAPRMLDQMRLKLQQEPWLAGRTRLLEADAAALPVEDAAFDVAVTAHLLHLVPDWRRVLDEIRRVVRPGGFYIQANDNTGLGSAAFKQAWRDLAQRRGFDPMPRRGIAEQDILDHFGMPPNALTQVTLARWSSQASVGEMLHRFRARESSRLWSLSEEDHAALMAELEAWAVATYGTTDTNLPSEASFHIAVFRF